MISEDINMEVIEIKKPYVEKNIKFNIISGVDGTPSDKIMICKIIIKATFKTLNSLNFNKKF